MSLDGEGCGPGIERRLQVAQRLFCFARNGVARGKKHLRPTRPARSSPVSEVSGGLARMGTSRAVAGNARAPLFSLGRRAVLPCRGRTEKAKHRTQG